MVKVLNVGYLSLQVEQKISLPKDSKIIGVVESEYHQGFSLTYIADKEQEEKDEYEFYVIPIGTEMYDTSLIGKHLNTLSLSGQLFSIFEKLKRKKNV